MGQSTVTVKPAIEKIKYNDNFVEKSECIGGSGSNYV